MNLLHKIKPLLITLSLCCAAPLLQPLSAADPEPAAAPAPWHVENAELRAPVKVNVKAAMLRMPPQVYLADLKPLEITDGLAFDPHHKEVVLLQVLCAAVCLNAPHEIDVNTPFHPSPISSATPSRTPPQKQIPSNNYNEHKTLPTPDLPHNVLRDTPQKPNSC
jgi:hypothetical protein